MAKKAKTTKKSKKATKAEAVERYSHAPEGFWRHVIVIALVVAAVLLLFGSIGAGGSLPVTLFRWARASIGLVAFAAPLLLIYAAIQKVRGEGGKIPRAVFAGLLILLAASAGFVHLFIDQEQSLAVADRGEGGGLVGHIVTAGVLTILNELTAGIILFVIALIALHFILRLQLSTIPRLFMSSKEVEEGAEAAEETKETTFKLNETVPVLRPKRLASLKNTAEQVAGDQSEALVATGDPNWKFPSTDLLSKKQDQADPGDVNGNSEIIKATMADFSIPVEMQGASVGPRVTQYALTPPNGVRLTKITALENNLALNLAATSIRMEAPIPGKRAVGVEVPNVKASTVRLYGLLQSNEWKSQKTQLSFAIGQDIAGNSIIGELEQMPHLLIAGATGSGKSVMINTFLISLLYRNSPADLKLILVDPKHVELTPYNDIPHLLTPVITEPERCISALKWAVAEMERRYRALSEAGKRNIAEYNKVKKEEGMPYVVIVIDELADLMMLAARDVETLIVRLAQKARAVGIHLVLATQRPSVDVITGLIKANIPARIAFTVASQVDSRTILDQAGAEKLLGQGDMLYMTPQLAKPKRLQGAFIDDAEINAVTDFLRMERAPEYDDEVVSQPVNLARGGVVGGGGADDIDDSLFEDAVRVVVETKKASTSFLQRRLRVGYARAARLIETMEERGIVGPADGARPREVLIGSMDELNDDPADDFEG